MTEPRIVTDPDGSRWVSVEIDKAIYNKLQAEGALEAFARVVNAEILRRLDEQIAGPRGER